MSAGTLYYRVGHAVRAALTGLFKQAVREIERAETRRLRKRAVRVIRKARRLPPGPERNELRQVAIALTHLLRTEQRQLSRLEKSRRGAHAQEHIPNQSPFET